MQMKALPGAFPWGDFRAGESGEERADLRDSCPLFCRLPEHPLGFWGTAEETTMWGCPAWRPTRKHLCSVHSSAGANHRLPGACNPTATLRGVIRGLLWSRGDST